MLILWYDVYLTKFTGRSELLLWSKYLLEHWSTKVHCDLARLLVRHQVKCAHYVNSKPNLNTDFWEIWREFGAVQLSCFIAYLICISFPVSQLPSAFRAEQSVNHLEFIKYFPLLSFAFHFQAFSPSPPKCNAEQERGWRLVSLSQLQGCSRFVFHLCRYSGWNTWSRLLGKVPWRMEQQGSEKESSCSPGKICRWNEMNSSLSAQDKKKRTSRKPFILSVY